MGKRARISAVDRDLFEDVLNPEVEEFASPKASTSALEPEEEIASEEVQPEGDGKVLDLAKLAKFNKKIDDTGVIYISRIPPGMGPSKLKHLLSQYGETDRVYLARDPKDTRSNNNKKQSKHQSHRFVEGWIEFLDKKKARRTAGFLNAQRIGGKKSDPFYDDIWTMKYLPKFKWSDLSASVAHQRAMEAALLRNEISQSKKSQASYLDQVDKARLLEKRKQREGEDGVEKESKKPKVEREFKQRATIKNNQPQGVSKSGKKTKKVEGCSKDDSGALQNVMDNLFG